MARYCNGLYGVMSREYCILVCDELLTSMCAKVFVSRRWPTGASQGVSPTTTTAETTFLSSREQRFSCTPEKHDPLFNSAEHLKMENHSICGIGYARHWWSCWKGEAAFIVLFVSGPGYIVSFSVEICPRVCPNGICPRVCPNGRTPPAIYARGFVPTANYAPGSVPTAATSRLPDSRSNQVSCINVTNMISVMECV